MDDTRRSRLEEAFKEQDTSQDDLTNDEALDRRCETESWQSWNFHWASALGTPRVKPRTGGAFFSSTPSLRACVTSPLLDPSRFVPRAHAHFERCHQPDLLRVLLEDVRESLVSDVLKGHALVTHDCLDCFPGLLIQLDALADHYLRLLRRLPSGFSGLGL